MPNSFVILVIFSLLLCNNTNFLYRVTSSTSSDDCDGPLVFSFPSFNATSCDTTGGLLCMGAVVSGGGFLNLTAGPPENSSATAAEMADLNAVARVLYKKPVSVWPASFCSSFSLRIFPHLNSTWSGDGMAFVLAQDNHSSPILSFGSYLGLQDQKTAGGTKFQQLAIEFDTFKNEFDPDDNHIAIDTTSVENSLVIKSLSPSSIYLKSGKQIKVKITYDGWQKQLQIYVGYVGNPLKSFLNHSIKVSKTIPSHVYVGFTASTGTLAETHQVLDWVFTATPLPYSSVKDSKREKHIIFATVFPVLGALILFGLCSFPIVRQRMIRKRERIRRMEDIERRSATTAPRKFTYKQLAKATKNFSKDNLLGTGGFGSVYKGNIMDPPRTIAVKKISANSEQGEREYLAEISTIGRLKHKNILQLQGWCHENEHLLLVYDYMPNKSLHQFLTGGGFLDWKKRYKILTGLASALLYLHEECGDPVVHRDVKPSNVMLDAGFNPRLGDFGLARLLKNLGGVTTMVAGTLGYMAPEVSYTGRATTESDVYSFGVVALEVVCGRRFINLLRENCLVDYVWDMKMKGCLLECLDSKLNGVFEVDQAMRVLSVALGCLDMDSRLRPRMRKVVQVLMNSDEALMKLPDSRPSGVYVSIDEFSNPLPSTTSTPTTPTFTYYSYDDSSNFTGESLAR